VLSLRNRRDLHRVVPNHTHSGIQAKHRNRRVRSPAVGRLPGLARLADLALAAVLQSSRSSRRSSCSSSSIMPSSARTDLLTVLGIGCCSLLQVGVTALQLVVMVLGTTLNLAP
jgi:hypothetical protein